MISLVRNDSLIDNRIDIKFENKMFTIYRVTRLQTTYSDNGIDLIIEGDASPNENGTFKRRSLEMSEHFMSDTHQDIYSYTFKCDYDNIFIRSKKITSFTITKKSNDSSYFNRLSQRD